MALSLPNISNSEYRTDAAKANSRRRYQQVLAADEASEIVAVHEFSESVQDQENHGHRTLFLANNRAGLFQGRLQGRLECRHRLPVSTGYDGNPCQQLSIFWLYFSGSCRVARRLLCEVKQLVTICEFIRTGKPLFQALESSAWEKASALTSISKNERTVPYAQSASAQLV